VVAAMNIMMYLQRKGILKIDKDGKKFTWDENISQRVIIDIVPANFKVLSSNQNTA
jgi:predicted transcriptional regulator